MTMEEGVVVRFNNAEGHGTIRADRGGDVYVHFSSIQMDGFRTLSEGQRVRFVRVPQPGPDGDRDVAWSTTPL